MKGKSLVWIIVIIAALVAIKLLFLKSDKGAAPKGMMGQKPVNNVTGFIVHETAFDNKLFSSGTLLAADEAILRPEVQGKLMSINFQEGAMVKKGELLAKINDADLQATLRKLALQLQLAEEKQNRLASLLSIKGISQEENDAALNSVATIKADMDYTKAMIAKTEIRAPFDGRIGLTQVSEGNFVNTSTIIASLQQINTLKVEFSLPEKNAQLIHAGDSVLFTVDQSTEQYVAKVYATEPKIDQQTRSFMVRARYANKNKELYPGSFARVEVIASKLQHGLFIPTEALIPELKGKKVFLYKSGKAISTKVLTGLRNDATVEITSGIQASDTIITTGIMSLKPDALVKLVSVKQ